MKDNAQKCDHRYIVSYLSRMPSFFENKLPCDNCGVKIHLSLPWRISTWLVDILSLLIINYLLTNFKIELFGHTFIPTVLLSSLILIIIQQIKRPIFRYGNWVEKN
mgnify:CR=1 FL=1